MRSAVLHTSFSQSLREKSRVICRRRPLVLPSLVQVAGRAVLKGLSQVADLDGLGLVQVSDGPGHPEDPVVASGGQLHPVIGLAHQRGAPVVQHAVGPQLLLAHLGVADQPLSLPALVAPVLDLPGGVDPAANLRRGLSRLPAGQLPEVQGRHLYLNINPVHQRPGDPAPVPLHLAEAAPAPARRVAVPAAFARVHGAHQHKPAGIGHGPGHSGDLDLSVLQRLAEHLQGGVLELGELVQEEDPPRTGSSGLRQILYTYI